MMCLIRLSAGAATSGMENLVVGECVPSFCGQHVRVLTVSLAGQK